MIKTIIVELHQSVLESKIYWENKEEKKIQMDFWKKYQEAETEKDKDIQIIIKELKELMVIYLNEDFDISNIAYTDGAKIIAKEEIEKNLKDEKYKMSNLIKVTPAGILIASHIFGVRKVKKLFNKVCYMQH